MRSIRLPPAGEQSGRRTPKRHAREDPVVRGTDVERDGRRRLIPPPRGTVTKTHPRHGFFWSIDGVREPMRRHASLALAIPRPSGVAPGLPLRTPLTHDATRVGLEADLPPTGVAPEERDVPSRRDERLDVVAHFPRPVFVMAHAQQQLVARRAQPQLGVSVEVNARAVVRRESLTFEPSD